jgi:tRNA(Ile)-lysidine synthase
MYYVSVKPLAQKVLEYIRKHELLKAGDRVGIAVSGGADSVALLGLLLELRQEIGIVLSVVHFNHKLRGADSDEDERFVAELARRHKLEAHCESGEVAEYAAGKRLSLEAAARAMRYRFFRRWLLEGQLNRIATAHTLDDQAETVLLKIVRGAGSRGLAGIYPQLSVAGSEFSVRPASIVRPLLAIRRREIESYLLGRKQSWREDKSNRDLRHMRNRVRHGILPRMERYLNPAVREALAATAEIARAEEEYWGREVARVLPSLWKVPAGGCHDAGATKSLDFWSLSSLPLAWQRRVIRAACEDLGLRLDFHHVEEILALSTNRAGSTTLPQGWMVSHKQGELCFAAREILTESDYEYCLSVPGSVEVRETDSRFAAVLVPGNAPEGYNPQDLLNRELLAAELKVRNWRAGDRFWPAHTKAPKKIKELLQEHHVTGPARKLWPVVVSGTDVVWVRGMATAAQWRAQNTSSGAVLIRELPTKERIDFAK